MEEALALAHHFQRAIILILLVFALIPRPAQAAPMASCVALRGLVLHAGDIPPGFLSARIGAVSLKESARLEHLSPAALRRHGYIAGYDGNFINPRLSAGTGIRTIDSEVTGYKNASGARWEYGYFVRANRKEATTTPHTHVRYLTLPGLGDERFGLVATEDLGKLTLTLATVVFQRGSYWGGISVLGQRRISSRAIIQYARLIDRKVSGATGVACK